VSMTKTFRKSLVAAVALLVALLGLNQVSASPLSDQQIELFARYEPVLRAVPSYELPAKSASLVALAKPAQKEAVALAVINVVSKVNPAAMTTVVGAISRTEPSLSVKLSAEAAKLQPKLTTDIHLATIVTTTPTSSSPTTAPTVVGAPTLVTTTTTSDPVPAAPGDPGSSGNGKKKGHYKNGVP